MSKCDLSRLAVLENGPLHTEGCSADGGYHELHARGLVMGGYNPHFDRYDVAITEAGREELRLLRRAHGFTPSQGNIHMVLNRLGYAYPGQVIREMIEAVCHAHEKHPLFAENADVAMRVLGEEFGEVCKAINDGDIDGAIRELAQVNAVTVRFMDLLMRGVA